MVTRAPIGRQRLETGEWWLGALVSAVLFALLALLLGRAFPRARIELAGSALAGTGAGIFHPRYILPFELVSLLLLAALVGAIYLARRD
jgi:NADH:ubiquinone oxidoreductase subunit 6 (subunit J)